MKKLFTLLTLFALLVIDVHSQTFQGVTEGDIAVTYTLDLINNRDTYAFVKSVDESAVGSDGVLELPEFVTYDGTEYPVVFLKTTASQTCEYLRKPIPSIKKIILHGKFILQPHQRYPTDFNTIFTNLEEIVMPESRDGFSTLDGVLYKGNEDAPYASILIVPVKWDYEGKNLYQPETKEIMNYAFRSVQFLGSMDVYQIPDQIEAIGNNAFNSSAIKGVKLPENEKYTAIAYECFDVCKDLTQVFIPNNVKSIYMAAFRECTSLPSINLNKVENIGRLAFYGDTSLASVESTENLNALGRCCFYGCIKLQGFDLGQSSITTIPAYCFWGCSNITEIKLPQGLTKIEAFAFQRNSKLPILELPESLVEIEEQAFTSFERNQTLFIGKNVKTMTGLSLWGVTCNIEIDSANPYFIIDDGVIYNKSKDVLVHYMDINSRKSFMVPSSVKRIGDGAFILTSNNSLEHITLPSSCEEIGYAGFYASTSKISSVTVPPSVKVFSGETVRKYYPNRNRTDSGGSAGYYYTFNNFDVFVMGNNIEEIVCNSYILTRHINTVRMYLTKTAFNKIDISTPKWGSLLSSRPSRLATDIPVTLSSTGLSTMCRDFDVDLSETNGLEAYVAASFEMPENGGDGEINMQKVSTGVYVPSRFGNDNYEFHGVVLKGEPGATYTYHIGEHDYLSGSQTTLSDEQMTGNMLVGAPVHVNIDKTDGNMTNFVLKNGWFRYVSAYGELAWNKAYLQVPTADVQTEDGHAKNIRFVFADDDSETTGISTKTLEHEAGSDNTSYYNLNGMRVASPQKGIYIRNGRKVVVR